MRRSVRQKVVGGAAVAVLLGGGALAAVSATGERNGNRHLRAAHAAHRLHRQDLIAAAGYLGISSEGLEDELRAARSLAGVAEAHGKSAQGLIDALVAARRARLAKAAARLPERVRAAVDGPVRLSDFGPGARRPGEPGPGAHPLRALRAFTAARHLGVAAASYLGLAPAQLRKELRSGRTLARLAETSPGKSSAGLLDALVNARKQRLAAAVAAGRLTPARAARSEARLRTRIGVLMQRKFARPAGR